MTETLYSKALASEISALKRARPKAIFLKCSLLLTVLYITFIWNAHFIFGQKVDGLVPTLAIMWRSDSTNYEERVIQFFTEIVPYPVRQDRPLSESIAWAWSLLNDHALEAAVVTTCIALISVLLAAGIGFSGALLQMGANLRTQKEGSGTGYSGGSLVNGLFDITSRTWSVLLIIMRAVPDLIWAFIILPILGPTPWTAIAALGIHNAGILGRLGRDLIRDARYPSLGPLQNIGTSASHLVLVSVLPAVFQKFLVHGFYRWESCLRDAVIVGMIGLPTLGFWIFQEAWSKFRYDEMMLYIVLSLSLVLIIETLSQSTRRYLNSP